MKALRTERGYLLAEAVSALQKTIRRGLEVEALYWAAEIETRYAGYLWRRLKIIANEDIGLAAPQVLVLVHSLQEQYDEAKARRNGPPDYRLMLANAVLALCRSPKTRTADDLQTVVYQRIEQQGWRMDVPDCALDKHTARGRARGRSWDHWREHGCVLDPKSETPNPYADEAHALRKTMARAKPADDPKTETQGSLF